MATTHSTAARDAATNAVTALIGAFTVKIPLDIASQGVGVLFDGMAGLLKNVPIVGEIAAELLLVGKSVLQWGLSVPGMLLDGVANIFGPGGRQPSRSFPIMPMVASPSPTSSFVGLDDIPMADSSYIIIPPDCGGAVGPMAQR